ncbi:MAG: hypothetical protein U0271_05345 [Polyangiaceae bacterium]
MRFSLMFSTWALPLLAGCASADHPDEEPAQRSSTPATLSASAASAASSPSSSAAGTAVASSTASQSASVATNQAPVVAPCDGEDERLYGSTCCEVRGRREDRFPGMVYLACHGPQIGQACSSKKDCDIACSCDPQGLPMRDHAGPPDGTRGAKGVCSGVRAVGVWMCDIDENGVVSHLIVD